MDDILPETEKIDATPTHSGLMTTKKKHSYHYLILICGIIALLLLGFIGGQSFERARIRHFIGWADNYERNFFNNQQMPPREMMRNIPPESFRSFAIMGKILTVENTKISIQEKNLNQEQAVVISKSTVIKHNNSNITVDDLKPEQKIAIFGKPNGNGQIEASLIRVLDESFLNDRPQDYGAPLVKQF